MHVCRGVLCMCVGVCVGVCCAWVWVCVVHVCRGVCGLSCACV